MTKTEHYHLNQWEPADRVLMTDFNEDNRKIEEALGAKCELVFGTYGGNNNDNRAIHLGFRPKAVFLCTEDGKTYNNAAYLGGLALDGFPAKGESTATGKINLITVTDQGFTVRNGAVQSGSGTYISANLQGRMYHYIAFR